MNIYQKLHKIQSQVLGLGKDKSSNSYKYVTGSKVLEHIKPLMNEYGLILKQEVLSIDNERQDYKVGINTPNEKVKSEILTKCMMRFTWIDVETGEKDENLFGANGQNDWEKGLGSALTYAERYFLLKYFHIATDEDDIDNPERKEQEEQLQKQEEQRLKEEKEKLILGYKTLLESSKTLEELAKNWTSIPPSKEKDSLNELKEKLKLTLK